MLNQTVRGPNGQKIAMRGFRVIDKGRLHFGVYGPTRGQMDVMRKFLILAHHGQTRLLIFLDALHFGRRTPSRNREREGRPSLNFFQNAIDVVIGMRTRWWRARVLGRLARAMQILNPAKAVS